MKMTTLLWRVVSVWLCVALVSWCPRSYVGCTESNPEAQRPHSPQDVRTEEESGEKTPYHEVEKSRVSPALSLPENEPLLEDNQQNEQTTQHLDKKELEPEASDVNVPTVEAEVEADKHISPWEPEAEPSSENPIPESDVVQEDDSAAQLSLSDRVVSFSADLKDDPSVIDLQDDILKSISEDASDVAAPELLEYDLPPADCEDDEEEEEEDNPYDNESSPPVVLENTSNAHSAGTITLIDPPLAASAAESAQHLESNAPHTEAEQDPSSPVATDTDSSASGKDTGDIPTFDEWKRKMMEVEKEKTQSTHTSNNGGSNAQKKAQKNFNNYASVECGAKILGANPEAKSTSAILKENMDLYMLNPCSNKIWFIIELCEPIQVKQLDIANFELFSSTPKDFLVSISDRYPTNKWLKLGTFHGRDERTVQSFPLDEHLYAKYVKMFTKYIKVELVSHFGSEHFCPLSLIRVFGTSMVEEYEEIADPSERLDDQDDDLDYPAGYAPGEVKLSKNLIGSAKDVILTMVNNIAVNVLGGGPEKEANVTSQDVNMTEPSAQTETTVETAHVNLTSVPDAEEEVVSPDPAIPETDPPSSETSESETPDTETSKQELPPVEEKTVTPLEEDGEEHISSTITVLDEEEELDEETEWMYDREQQENQCYCALLPCFSSSCSCAATLQEYLLRQCSVLLSKKRKCQTTEKRQRIPPTAPTWQPPLSPSMCPEPQVHHTEAHELPRTEHSSEREPESGAASPPEAAQPWENTMESRKEPVSEPHVLEPSQTPSLPGTSAADSSTATAPIVQTPPLPPEETAVEQTAELSQHVFPAAEGKAEPSPSLTSSIYVTPSVGASAENASGEPTEEKSDVDESQFEVDASLEIPERTDQSQPLLPATPVHVDSDPPAAPIMSTAPPEPPHPAPDSVAEPEPSADLPFVTETKMPDLTDDASPSSASNGHQLHPSPPALPTAAPPSLSSPSHLDIYAETTYGTAEQNGNQVHGSSSKESVFMRLNNRIKALEMNMSLSGRYLEQLSQRYRKQMEEMQKAFNKTIITLQNTSKMAEEQDLRQTESIQLLQGQLENVTQLVLYLSDRVSELQNEVSDRQNYLLLSLALCVCLGLLLCANRRRIRSRPITDPASPIPISDTYCWPERQFSEYEETGLKRSASYPLINSESFQLSNTEGHEIQHGEGTQSLSQANRKRRRRKVKPVEKVETLTPSVSAPSELSNGAVLCNGAPNTTIPTPFAHRFIQPLFRDSPSEGSSEASSSHSDDPSFCGITTACSRICDGLPQPKSRAERRASRRRRPKPGCAVVNLLQVPKRDNREPMVATIEGLMKERAEKSSGTFGANAALSGPV